jgi:glycosyl transferase family 87
MTARRGSTVRTERLLAGMVIAVAAAYIAFGLRTAANTFGCDFSAYYGAAGRWLHGGQIYDLSVLSTGSCGTYQYPPPFVLLAAPFSLLGFDAGNWLWIGFLIGCWAVGTAILPVRVATRWMVLLLGAIGWPLIFGVRIGQVAPVLYLVFAWGWRNLDQPVRLGIAVALGTMVKLQPGLLGIWLLARRDWRAVAAAAVAGLAIVVIAAAVGLWDWLGLLTLLRSLTDAVTVPTNLALGATLYSQGLNAPTSGTIQTVNTILVLVVVVVAGLRLPRTAGYLLAIVASQLVSPILWSHYALLLMLPVAWLLDRRLWWAAIIPIAEAWILLPVMPNWTYTVAFYAVFVALLVLGWRTRDLPEAAAAMPDPRVAAAPTAAGEAAS